mmetsp:Transcript_14133/g.59025  ORF Transcript_14133/g.59025 Transcript_14133/m.59025 type:complete len:272 (+) Transcript_14133:1206-2021(+)
MRGQEVEAQLPRARPHASEWRATAWRLAHETGRRRVPLYQRQRTDRRCRLAEDGQLQVLQACVWPEDCRHQQEVGHFRNQRTHRAWHLAGESMRSVRPHRRSRQQHAAHVRWLRRDRASKLLWQVVIVAQGGRFLAVPSVCVSRGSGERSGRGSGEACSAQHGSPGSAAGAAGCARGQDRRDQEKGRGTGQWKRWPRRRRRWCRPGPACTPAEASARRWPCWRPQTSPEPPRAVEGARKATLCAVPHRRRRAQADNAARHMGARALHPLGP